MFVINEFILICGLVLTVLSLNSVTAKKFCTAFTENNQKIDYTISQPNTNINFVIDGLFWTINQYSEKNSQKFLKFSSEESKTTTFFTSEYKFGSIVFFTKNHNLFVGFVILFNKSNLKSVAIGKDFYGDVNSDLSKFSKRWDSEVTNELIPKDAVFAFPEDFGSDEPTKVVFVKQVGSGYDIELLQFYAVTESNTKATKNTSQYSMAVIKKATNLVYVSSLWDAPTKTYKLFLLFKANNNITYCYTEHDKWDETCDNPKVLISCPVIENGGSSSMPAIIAIIIIIILIVVIIGFVVFYFNRPNASESVAANSQLSGMNAPLSKRSGDVTSKVASKTGAKGTSNVPSKNRG